MSSLECYESLTDFAKELTEVTTLIPQNLVYYIDYARLARGLDLSGDVTSFATAHDEVHIF